MTDAEYAMLVAMERSSGDFVPDLTVQQHRDVILVLQRKKYITWNAIGDGYVMLGNGKNALAEERLRRRQAEIDTVEASLTRAESPAPPVPSKRHQLFSRILDSVVTAVVEAIARKLQ